MPCPGFATPPPPQILEYCAHANGDVRPLFNVLRRPCGHIRDSDWSSIECPSYCRRGRHHDRRCVWTCTVPLWGMWFRESAFMTNAHASNRGVALHACSRNRGGAASFAILLGSFFLQCHSLRSQLRVSSPPPPPVSGSNLAPNCSDTIASIGSLPLTLTSCNTTTIVASTPTGAGVVGTLSLIVGGQTASRQSGASQSFAYRAPSISALVRTLPRWHHHALLPAPRPHDAIYLAMRPFVNHAHSAAPLPLIHGAALFVSPALLSLGG